jgi:pyridoxamine 5'-phosphate oxidase-like protein
VIKANELVEFMRANPLATVATISADGGPEAAVVGVAVSDRLELVFDTLDTSRKFLNVKGEPRIAAVFGAAGAYRSGKHDERSLQYEGMADVPVGEELGRVQESIYFKQFPDGRARMKWAHIAYVRVTPVWIRYSDYNVSPPRIVELRDEELAKLVAGI